MHCNCCKPLFLFVIMVALINISPLQAIEDEQNESCGEEAIRYIVYKYCNQVSEEDLKQVFNETKHCHSFDELMKSLRNLHFDAKAMRIIQGQVILLSDYTFWHSGFCKGIDFKRFWGTLGIFSIVLAPSRKRRSCGRCWGKLKY
ncbi:MAG: cysteine peptidase family C39 domain-containing protein [Candidatus Sumerlaeota bacterium]|nr:cysteine peptidase family C39 domain-containing protein [Candidatus Sumerlaeota bacterium]